MRPFEQFRDKVWPYTKDANQAHLRTEWETAYATGQMADRWQKIRGRQRRAAVGSKYRTVHDSQVKATHRALDGIVRRVDDPFWIDSKYPPNGYNCRCDVDQLADGEETPQSHIDAIPPDTVPPAFRFNAGKTGEVFSPEHPYFQVPRSAEARKADNFGLVIPDGKAVVSAPARVPKAPKPPKPKPFKLTEDHVKQLVADGWNVYNKAPAEVAQAFNRKLPGFDLPALNTEMADIGSKWQITWEDKNLYIGPSEVRVTYIGQHSSGQVRITREFKTIGRVKSCNLAYHNLFTLPEPIEGKGISVEVIRAWTKQYLNAKIKQIDVFANITVGGYAWAKYGFEATDIDEVIGTLKNSKADLATDSQPHSIVDEKGKTSTITKRDFSDVMKFLDQVKSQGGKTIQMSLLADKSFGKALLLNTNWHGSIDLTNKVALERFLHYLKMIP